MSPKDAIQGAAPSRHEAASGVEHYCHLVAEAASEGRAVVDYGTRCRGLGHPPPEGHFQITPPIGILEHAARDLYVRVAGGTPLGTLQATLAEQGQRLPIDGVEDQATLAEIIAHNLFGPRRLAHGSMRDLLLGLTFINASGEPVSVGGRTVKNVAGYDLTRGMVGSMNMLGLIAEATLRTATLAPTTQTVRLARMPAEKWDAWITALVCHDARPDGLSAFAIGTQLDLHLIYEGPQDNVQHRLNIFKTWVSSHLPESASLDFTDAIPTPTGERLMRLFVTPSQSLKTAAALAEQLGSGTVEVQPAFGVIWIWDMLPSVERALQIDRAVQGQLSPTDIRTWWQRPDGAEQLAPFAPKQTDWALFERMKKAMDPKAMFNPGRFP